MNANKKKATLISCAVLTALAWGVPQAWAAGSPLPASQSSQVESKVRGVVTDVNGEPLIGASVMVKGTSRGTATDLDGNYTIDAKKGEVLTFSYVGYIPSEVKVGDDQVINV